MKTRNKSLFLTSIICTFVFTSCNVALAWDWSSIGERVGENVGHLWSKTRKEAPKWWEKTKHYGKEFGEGIKTGTEGFIRGFKKGSSNW